MIGLVPSVTIISFGDLFYYLLLATTSLQVCLLNGLVKQWANRKYSWVCEIPIIIGQDLMY